jgi:hypothetical protein
MRSAIIAASSALATLAMVSTVSAQNDQGASGQSRVTTNQTPTVSDNASGLTVEQENTIPYRPCMEAYGSINGRLRCGITDPTSTRPPQSAHAVH